MIYPLFPAGGLKAMNERLMRVSFTQINRGVIRNENPQSRLVE